MWPRWQARAGLSAQPIARLSHNMVRGRPSATESTVDRRTNQNALELEEPWQSHGGAREMTYSKLYLIIISSTRGHLPATWFSGRVGRLWVAVGRINPRGVHFLFVFSVGRHSFLHSFDFSSGRPGLADHDAGSSIYAVRRSIWIASYFLLVYMYMSMRIMHMVFR